MSGKLEDLKKPCDAFECVTLVRLCVMTGILFVTNSKFAPFAPTCEPLYPLEIVFIPI